MQLTTVRVEEHTATRMESAATPEPPATSQLPATGEASTSTAYVEHVRVDELQRVTLKVVAEDVMDYAEPVVS